MVEDDKDLNLDIDPSFAEVNLTQQTDDWLADERYRLGRIISQLARKDEIVRACRDSINQEFQRRFDERGSTATKTNDFTISARIDDKYPEIEDRNAFESYILSTGAIYLLQSRLSMSAVQEEIAAGKNVPGVRLIRKITINQSKRAKPKDKLHD